ncbi:hypothetical protein TEA_029513 [Camellia sinensis var. sinensis]|uniref:Glucan endo-1,3-beta-D-glucosidase n=1 Tax=Camellia sinensis var. sinensis TaxID=542762 RepID=A0A4S4DU00_CAMSN|nr:hypothetical protein TEA_029513 [Camellia sinensis var. sinensis]
MDSALWDEVPVSTRHDTTRHGYGYGIRTGYGMEEGYIGIECRFCGIRFLIHVWAAAPIEICYGRLANNIPPPSTAVNLLKSNGITTVRLFNADPDTLTSFSGSDISLMIGVPNKRLPSLTTTTIDPSLQWLQSNIFSHISPTQIKYIAVGNEILLKDPFYTPYLVPAMNNLYIGLQTLGLSDTIKLSTSHAASILMNSYPPSASSFDPNHQSIMGPLLQFLKDNGPPLMVNVYPFFSFTNNPQFVSLDCVHVMVNGKVHVETSMVRFTSKRHRWSMCTHFSASQTTHNSYR